MSCHANSVVLTGKIIQHWTYDNNVIVRIQMARPIFYRRRKDGNLSDLVNVVLPDAVLQGQTVQVNQEMHVQGYIHSEERETLLSSMLKGVKLDEKYLKMKVRQIVTEVIAQNWQIV
jgi:uncharacterized protein YdeI (BOF family)